VGCEAKTPGDACTTGFLRTFTRQAWRRPAEPAELDALATVVKTTTAEQGSVWTGLEYAVAAVLQAPSFLYLPELGEVDPEDPKRLRLTSLELGSRLAFLLTNAPPDRELLDAGERGELLVVATLRKQAERLLQTPRARAALASFFAEHLRYEELEEKTKSKAAFPTWTPALMTALRRELDTLTTDLALGSGSALDLLDTREARVNKALAALYELPAPATDSFTQATHRADRPRAGVMTSAGVMAALSGNRMTSPTFRGLLVRERLLCQQAPEPPDGVNTDLEMVGKARTTRERVEQHRSNAACAACHAFMDPIGLTFESFDALGRFRTSEGGAAIDTSGDLDGKRVTGPRDLAAALRADPRTAACLVREVYRFGTGHEEQPGEAVAQEALGRAFANGNHNLRGLLVELVANAGFRYAARR
jgi:hypothetical protein